MTSSDAKQPAEESGSMLPTVLAGAGILVVAGLMIFWPDSSTETAKAGAAGNAGSNAARDGAAGTKHSGVPVREADEASGRPPQQYKVNPRLRPAQEFGMSPNPPSNEPPKFENNDEELDYWRLQLSEAKRVLAMREKAIERLPKIKEQIMAGNDPEGGLASFARREEVIHENLGKQKAKVKEIEEKLGALEEAASP